MPNFSQLVNPNFPFFSINNLDYYFPMPNFYNMYNKVQCPSDYYAMKNSILVEQEVYELFNQPVRPSIDIACTRGIYLDKNVNAIRNLRKDSFKLNNIIFNKFYYKNIYKVISDAIVSNSHKADQYFESVIYAYHLRYWFPNNIPEVKLENIAKVIEYMCFHYARNFIVLAQTTYEPGMINPTIHFIISNAIYKPDRTLDKNFKGNYTFSKNISSKLERADNGLNEYAAYGKDIPREWW